MEQENDFRVIENSEITAIYMKHKQNGSVLKDSKFFLYELNSKLFQIHEPYLMKTEREAFVNLEEKLKTVDLKNLGSKRKRSLFKKINQIQGNFNEKEFEVVNGLLKECLKQTYSDNNSILFSNSGNLNFDNVLAKIGSLMNQLKSSDCDSNSVAQDFVSQLFRNRFQAQNYFGLTLRNPNSFSILSHFGMVDYIIPSNCSFSSKDIIEGLRELKESITFGNVSIFDCDDPFFILLDPAWENKSVKRMKTYDMINREYLESLCEELKCFVLTLSEKFPRKRISVSVWTTEAELDFTLKNIIAFVGLKIKFVFKWHKITTQGCPVKIHGNLEYLVIADNDSPFESMNKSGILSSIPSAIHSHKPPLLQLWNWIYGTDFHNEINQKHGDKVPNSEENILQESQIISPVKGVELFARYLTSGFHSIGRECIHINADNVFSLQAS